MYVTYDYEKHRLIYLSTYSSQTIHVWIKQWGGGVKFKFIKFTE